MVKSLCFNETHFLNELKSYTNLQYYNYTENHSNFEKFIFNLILTCDSQPNLYYNIFLKKKNKVINNKEARGWIQFLDIQQINIFYKEDA